MKEYFPERDVLILIGSGLMVLAAAYFLQWRQRRSRRPRLRVIRNQQYLTPRQVIAASGLRQHLQNQGRR